jgi:hypothetical protein
VFTALVLRLVLIAFKFTLGRPPAAVVLILAYPSSFFPFFFSFCGFFLSNTNPLHPAFSPTLISPPLLRHSLPLEVQFFSIFIFLKLFSLYRCETKVLFRENLPTPSTSLLNLVFHLSPMLSIRSCLSHCPLWNFFHFYFFYFFL